MKKLLPMIVLSAACSFQANAQPATENAGPAADTISDVIIAGYRLKIPFSQVNRNVTLISKEDIAKLPVQSVNELLSYIAGIDVRRRGPNGTQADISMDGGGFDQTLVLLNGIKMSDPQTGHNMMNIPVPLSSIERIEILKGAAARVYGINAMMGVINIVTVSPNENSLSAGVYGGSSFTKNDSTGNMFLSYGADITAAYHHRKMGHLLSAGYDGGNGYRYNTDYKNAKLFYQNQFRPSEKIYLSTQAGYVNNAFGANSFYAAPADVNSTEAVQVFVAGSRADIRAGRWVVSPGLSYRYAKDDYIFIKQNPDVYHNIHETNTLDASLNSSYATGIGTLGMGLNYRSEFINSNNLGKDDRSNTGFFAEFRFKTSPKFDFTLGAFANYNSVFGFNVYPGADIGWQATSRLRLFANAGTGQRLPTFTDLYYKGPSNIGNADLMPEWATTAEVGAKYRQGGWNAGISAFYRNGRKFIDWTRADTMQPWQPQNFFEVNTLGLNLNLDYNWKTGDNLQGAIHTGYTYLDPTMPESEGTVLSRYVINSLQQQWVLRADVTLLQHLNISLANRYLHRLNASNTGDYRLRNYDLLDAKISYSPGMLSFYAECSNLLNVQYIENGVVPLPGRWMTVGVRVKM